MCNNKNLCGRDGRTICGPLRVPKSTYVTLAHERKQKFFYFGCSVVRRFYCKVNKNNNGTDGQTDRVRRNMRPPPREEGRIITHRCNNMRSGSLLRLLDCDRRKTASFIGACSTPVDVNQQFKTSSISDVDVLLQTRTALSRAHIVSSAPKSNSRLYIS